jgi:hypothetical protein
LIDNGATREAKAVTDIAYVNLGGAIQLTGLHWESVTRSTGDAVQTGSFTIGSATIGGAPIPTNDPNQAIAQVNQFLATTQLGIQIAAPISRQTAGVQFVDPLGIQVVPSHTRDMAASAVLGGAQPLRQGIFDALLGINCKTSTPIILGDIFLGSITGAGSLNVTLGGVQSMSGEVAKNPYQLGTFQLANRPTLSAPAGGTLGGSSAGRPASSPATGAPAAAGGAAPPAAAPAPAKTAPVAAIKSPGARGGAMAGVGLASLGLLAALAAMDQRKMRHAQRDIPQFTV